MPRKPKAKLYLRFRTLDGKQSPYCPALLTASPVFVPSGASLKV